MDTLIKAKTSEASHYEKKPIQIYWKFYLRKLKKILDKKLPPKNHISAHNIDVGIR